MEKEAILKNEGEKLIRVSGTVENNIIKSIRIFGDFFVYPEEGIELLCDYLVGKELSNINIIIKGFFDQYNITPYGISTESISEAITKLAHSQN